MSKYTKDVITLILYLLIHWLLMWFLLNLIFDFKITILQAGGVSGVLWIVYSLFTYKSE